LRRRSGSWEHPSWNKVSVNPGVVRTPADVIGITVRRVNRVNVA
jgi:hypothetical protein